MKSLVFVNFYRSVKRKKELAPIIIVGLVLLFLFLFSFDLNFEKKSDLADNLTGAIVKCNSDPSCYDDIFSKYLKDKDSQLLLGEFKLSMEANAEVRKDCHQIAHAIGRAVLVRVGNISDVFRFDRSLDTCSGGFFHGAIEGLFRPDGISGISAEDHVSLDEFKNKIPTLCDQFEKINRKSECVHGVGHGALFLIGDLKESLSTCRLFPKSFDHFSCYSGIFMEYAVSGKSKEDNKNDPYFPCNQFKDPYRVPCYYVLSFRMVDLDFSGEKIIEKCREATDVAGGFCVRGYGIFFLAHEALAQGPEPVVEFCEKLSQTNARVCAESVASRLAAYATNGRYAMPFCSMFTSDYIRERCFSYTADVLLLGHKIDAVTIKEDCKKHLSNPYECIAAIKK